ncbi:MAG: TauD/TfdA family dioxygenase [Sneathiella sp.]|nr:TauD/TfdA family dioxygenase [Sneathiella sp.]
MIESDYFSYKDQTRHYFNRPHSGVLSHPLQSNSAWYGSDLRENGSFIQQFSKAEITEIEEAIKFARHSGKPVKNLRKEDFPLPGLSKRFELWKQEISDGRGFLVLRGIPVEKWSVEEAELFFWAFGLHLGRPGAQNQEGDLLGHVKDTGSFEGDALPRLYKTAANIDYHCDGADVVGLLCLKKAKIGGKSRIVSSVSVFNELVKRRPELAERLFEPVLLDIRNEKASKSFRHISVIPCRYDNNILRTFYHADYFRSVTRHDDVAPFAMLEQELFDTYEEIAADPNLYLDMDLEPGDIQLLSNHTNLHARTDYVDYEEEAEKRHLLRLWISL